MSGVRTFIGIPLPDDVVDAYLVACESLRDLDHAWREQKWVPSQNLHVTLKFLGDIAEESLESLGDAVAQTTARHPAFALTDPGFRAVPNRRRARMLWGTFLDPEGSCAALAEDLDRACLAFGVGSDTRTFKPHATLVRARQERRVSELAIEAARDRLAGLPRSVSVPSVRLYSSRLTDRDPVYTVLRECPLMTV